MAKIIQVNFPFNRILYGNLVALDGTQTVFGPVEAYGKSDNQKSASVGNLKRDPSLPFGDTPAGQYSAVVGHLPDTPENRHAYGDPDETKSIPVIWLQPVPPKTKDVLTQAQKRQVFENAKEGKHVNMGLAIHSGPLNAHNTMRPTYGCVRLLQKDMTDLLAILKGDIIAGVEIREGNKTA